MSDYLKYDTGEMGRAISNYVEAANTMDEIQSRMCNMVDSIRDSWQSEAGQEFFKKFYDEWLKNFDYYKEVLLHMIENLSYAGDEYNRLSMESRKMKL